MLENFISSIISKKAKIQSFLKPNGKNLLLTHQSCLDGRTCDLVARKVFSNLICVKLPASNQDFFLEHYDLSRFDAIIMADLSTNSPLILNRRNFIMIDHHETSIGYTGNFVFHSEEKCGSYLLKTFLETALDVDLSSLNTLLDYVNDYDTWEKKIEDSSLLEHLFRVYPWQRFQDRFGTFDGTFTDEEREIYAEEQKRLQNVWDGLTIHVDGHCIVVLSENFNNDLCERIFQKTKTINAIVWVWFPFGGSIRLRGGKESIFSVGEYLKSAGLGGGHRKAGGFRINSNQTLEGVVEKIKNDLKGIE